MIQEYAALQTAAINAMCTLKLNYSCHLDEACMVNDWNYQNRPYKCAPAYMPFKITSKDPNDASLGEIEWHY